MPAPIVKPEKKRGHARIISEHKPLLRPTIRRMCKDLDVTLTQEAKLITEGIILDFCKNVIKQTLAVQSKKRSTVSLKQTRGGVGIYATSRGARACGHRIIKAGDVAVDTYNKSLQ